LQPEWKLACLELQVLHCSQPPLITTCGIEDQLLFAVQYIENGFVRFVLVLRRCSVPWTCCDELLAEKKSTVVTLFLSCSVFSTKSGRKRNTGPVVLSLPIDYSLYRFSHLPGVFRVREAKICWGICVHFFDRKRMWKWT
jgi:hypothetical protein